VSREQAYRARQTQIQAHARQVEATADHRGELLGVQQRTLGRAAGHQHQELRLAEACQRVLSGHRLLQAAGGFAQHFVADLQSERGVDVAQVRDVDEQQRRLYPGLESLKLGRGGDRQLADSLD